MKNVENLIKEIDEKIEKLEKEQLELEDKKLKGEKKIKNVDYTKEAIESIRECVSEILKIDDLKTYRDKESELHSNRILRIIQWFNYLKREKSDTKEYEEAKDLVMSIGEKHLKLYDWCKEMVEKPVEKTSICLNGVELNIDETNEFIINDDAKIVVDVEKAKKIIDTEFVLGSQEYKELSFEYKVVVNKKEYTHLYHVVDYVPRCEIPENCPYIVYLIGFEKNNNERILKFNIFERN